MRNKRILFWLTMVLSISLFAACSSDDDYNFENLNGDYNDAKLNVTYSDSELLGGKAVFAAQEGNQARITLYDILPGIDGGHLEVTLTESNGGGYVFNGTQAFSTCDVEYEGSIRNDVINLDLDVVLKNQALVGTWDYSKILFNWEAEHQEAGLTAWMLSSIINQYIVKILENVTFRKDGNIVASYADFVTTDAGYNPSFQTSPKNLAQYYVSGNNIYVVLKVANILKESGADASDYEEMIEAVMGNFPKGIPLNYRNDGTQLDVFLDKDDFVALNSNELVQMGILLLKATFETIEDPNLAVQLEFLINFIDLLDVALPGTTKLELGLSLTK